MNSKTETLSNRLKTISSYSSDKMKNKFLSNKKKIENEILLMNNETKKDIKLALNKYTFNNEVFLPTPLRITKKEYIGKNYLLNNLVNFERNNMRMKNYIKPLNTEAKIFFKQYQLIMDENKEHQSNYLGNLQKFYRQKGYNINGIGNVKEIFNPSFLLDNNFGNNIVDDAFRYGYKEYKADFNADENLMKKWNNGITETKDNRSKQDKGNENKDINAIFERDADMNKKKLELEEERANMEFQQKIESIKKKLLEEDKIKNMTKKEYNKYSSNLKKEINKTKKTIEDLSSTNASIDKSNKSNNTNLKSIPKNKIHKTYKIIHPSHNKNYKQKIVFTSITRTRKNTEDNFMNKMKAKSKKSSPKKSEDFFISLDKEKEKNKRKLPKIKIASANESNNATKENLKEKKEKINKSKEQIKELNDLYNLVSNNKEDFFTKYPNNNVEKYFKKYTKKVLPVLNIKKGSNVHGIFDDFQQISNKNNLDKITKSSNELKKRFRNNANTSLNEYKNNNYTSFDKLKEMDEKIPIMHYIFAEELMIKKSSNDE